MTDEKILEIARHYAIKNTMDRYLVGVDGAFTGETEIVTCWNFYEDEKLLAFAKSVIEADRESNDKPVAWMANNLNDYSQLYWDKQEAIDDGCAFIDPLYTRPSPARKPLSDEEVEKEFNRRCELDCCPDFSEAVRWAEKMHGIGETE